MKAPLEWLQSLVEIKSSPEELARKLSLTSIGVDKVDYVAGQPVLDIDVTYNRGDLLSMVGLAYEISFVEKSSLHLPTLKTNLDKIPELEEWQIIRNSESCPLYVLVLLKLKNTPSPEWMKKRLSLISSQSRGIIVDAANYVMWEYGQPFHTFDAQKIKTKTIRVQPAGKEVEFTTLDGKKRKLSSDDILILDDQRPIALAGIMGGEDTEIESQSELVLLEMALFNPYQIRKTAMSQGLFSDAANHFIHKPSPNSSFLALRRLLDLYQEYAQAEVKGMRISGQTKVVNPQIRVSQQDIKRLIGLDIPPQEVVEILRNLHFEVKASSEGGYLVRAPHWRSDVQIKEDVIEEVIRGFGYWKLKSEPLPLKFIPQQEEGEYYHDLQLKNFLTGQGLYQLNTFGFFGQKEIESFAIKKRGLIAVTNPISREAQFLKTTLIPGVVLYLQENQKNPLPLEKAKGVFEINSVYLPKERPTEEQRLVLGIRDHLDFYQLVNALFSYLRLDYAGLRVEEGDIDGRLDKLTKNIGEVLTLFYQGRILGVVVRTQGVWLLEVDYTFLLRSATFQPQPQEEVKYSPWIEDLTFKVKDKIRLINFLFNLKTIDPRVSEVIIEDTYKDRITLRLAYLDRKKQLTATEAAEIRRKIVAAAGGKQMELIGKLE